MDVRPTPGPVPGLTDVAHIAAGAAHTCALRSTGGVLCWGANGSGQSGEESLATQRAPAWVFGI